MIYVNTDYNFINMGIHTHKYKYIKLNMYTYMTYTNQSTYLRICIYSSIHM